MQIFWIALAVRLLYMTLARTYHVRPFQDHFGFGWECGRIARALVNGFGYADPFTGHTGPTAWTPPLYPLLLATVFKVFGVYTAASAWVTLAINCIFSAAIVPAIFEISIRIFGTNAKGRSIALWSSWIWAIYPAAMQYSVRWIWEMSITACLFTWVIVLALRVRGVGDSPHIQETQTIRRWIVFGFLWALLAMSNSTLLLFLPVCGIWMLLRGDRKEPYRWASLAKASLTAGIFFLCLAPWTARNWIVFHELIPMRGNFGAELYSSVLEGNNGFEWGPTIPLAPQAPEYKRYQSMGEVRFVRAEAAQAKTYIKNHKKSFLQIAVKRIYFFWVSVPHPSNSAFQEFFRVFNFCFASLAGIFGLILSIRRRIPGAWLFAWAFALLPLTYYFVLVAARFRHPLEPLITILAVYLFQSATRPKAEQTTHENLGKL